MTSTELVKRSSDFVEPLQHSGDGYVGTFTLQQPSGWPRYDFYVNSEMNVFLALIIDSSHFRQEVYFQTEESDLVNKCYRRRSGGKFVYSEPSQIASTDLKDPVLRTAFDPNVSIEEMMTQHCLGRSQNYRAHPDAIDELMTLGGIYNGR